MNRFVIVFLCLTALLASCGKPEAVYQGKTTSQWVADLKGQDTAVRRSAVKALVQIGQDAIPALAKTLQQEEADWRARSSAAQGLGQDRAASRKGRARPYQGTEG